MCELLSDGLLRIAQNDYMIDGKFLPDGKLLQLAVATLDSVHAERAAQKEPTP